MRRVGIAPFLRVNPEIERMRYRSLGLRARVTR